MFLRKATDHDLLAICQLLIHTWQTSQSSFLPSAFLTKLDINIQLERHRKYLKRGTQYFLVENNNKDLMGFASFGTNRSSSSDFNFEIYTLYVHPKFQRNGVGALLLAEICAALKDENKGIVVSFFEGNPYKEFYLKNGFKKLNEEMVDLGEIQLLAGSYCKYF